jgi:hypothetical protein
MIYGKGWCHTGGEDGGSGCLQGHKPGAKVMRKGDHVR